MQFALFLPQEGAVVPLSALLGKSLTFPNYSCMNHLVPMQPCEATNKAFLGTHCQPVHPAQEFLKLQINNSSFSSSQKGRCLEAIFQTILLY